MKEIHFHTEHEVDIFLKNYVDSIPNIEKVYDNLLAESIKEDIKEMELPNFEDGMKCDIN